MKITKKQLAVSLISIGIILISVALMLCDFLIPLNIWTHPILTFLFAIFSGFGVLTLVLGIVKRSSWYFFLSSILLGLAIIYVLLQYIPWWIGVVIMVCVWAILAIVCFTTSGSKTEDIALNNSTDYKNYEQRKAEKEQMEEEEEIPEIKSFK